MREQSINWIALPGGVTPSGACRLSVFIAPRLFCSGTGGRLEDYPDFVNWPARVRQLVPHIIARTSLDRGAAVDKLEGVRVISDGMLDSELWIRLFHPKMKVKCFEFDDLSERPIISYPVRGVVSYLREVYHELAHRQGVIRPRLSEPGLEKLAPISPAAIDQYLPSRQRRGSDVDRVRSFITKKEGARSFNRTDFYEAKGIDGTSVNPASFDFGLATRFHHRPMVSADTATPNRPEEITFDFHTLLSALGDYPILLRRLGLVIDLEFPALTMPSGFLAVEPAFSINLSLTTNYLQPWTSFEAGKGYFAALPSEGERELRRGLLDLSMAGEIVDRGNSKSGSYDLVQIDPDGAVLKVLNFARTASQHGELARTRVPFGLEDEQGAPTLRSAGLSLARFGRAGDISGRLLRAREADQALTSPASATRLPVLHAEDLLRGYRFDVFDSNALIESAVGRPIEKLQDTDFGRWFSLCWRAGRYTVHPPEGETFTLTTRRDEVAPSGPCPVRVKANEDAPLLYDEGYVKAASTTSNEATGAEQKGKELYLHESLARWSGWGLCIERPEATLRSGSVNDRHGAERQVEYISRLTPAEIKGGDVSLEAEFRAIPGTLPRLRFGHAYRMRARAVDLGGGGLCHNDAGIDNAMASRPVLYKRFEPVAPPTLVTASVRLERSQDAGVVESAPLESTDTEIKKRRALPTASLITDGESLETMVIRSNHDATAEEWVTLDRLAPDKVPPAADKSDELRRHAEIARRTALVQLLAGKHYRAVNERHIAPPSASQQFCETHGVLDADLATPNGRRRAFRICSRESRTFNDTETPRYDGDGEMMSLNADIEFLPMKAAERQEGAEQTPVHLEDQLLVPYLPDPLARGVTFWDLPGAVRPSSKGEVPVVENVGDIVVPAQELAESSELAQVLRTHMLSRVRFPGQWPDPLPFKLRIADKDSAAAERSQNGAPIWDPGVEGARGASLTVFLEKAEVARVRYSSFIDPRDVEIMGMWEWSMQRGRTDDQALEVAKNLRDPSWEPTDGHPMREMIHRGLHWMFTPYRELVLVHAVQQPLSRPTFVTDGSSDVVLQREAGSTHVSFANIEINIDARSTGHLDLYARWSDQIDPVTEPLPRDKPARLPRTEDPGPAAGRLSDHPDWEDGEAARFAEMFPRSHPKHPAGSTDTRTEEPGATTPEDVRTSPRFSGHAFGVDVPAGMPNEFRLGRLNDHGGVVRHDFGDTRHRVVFFHLVATTRFREYFPPELWADPVNITRVGPAIRMNVPSSARPATPKVLYVVPTFGWEGPREVDGSIFVKRCGGGLRVYMDRPWYSSGEGELLGVILRNDNSVVDRADDDDRVQSCVTGWGVDPGWTSVADSGAPPLPMIGELPDRMADDVFKGTARMEVRANLVLPELDGLNAAASPAAGGPTSSGMVKAIGYKPEYDATRGLWYCDIEIDVGAAYFPFIRLALARFQPNSVPGVELSPVVQLDFVQVAPDRVAAVVFGADQRNLTVAVSATPAQPSWGEVETPVVEDGSSTGSAPRGDGLTPTPLADKGRYLLATLETAPAAGADVASLDTLRWTPVQDQEVRLNPGAKAGDLRAIWIGALKLPDASRRSGGSGIYRVMVKEYELLPADIDGAGAREVTPTVQVAGRGRLPAGERMFAQERLVFAAAIYV